jgi:hypothetical protein
VLFPAASVAEIFLEGDILILPGLKYGGYYG